MKKKNRLLVLAGVFVALMLGAYGLYGLLGQSVTPDQPVAQKAQSGGKTPVANGREQVLAPSFTVYDAEGNAVTLEDFGEGPKVLNFWASWCGPCKMEMPHFQQAYEDLGEEVQFLMINMTTGRETQESAQQFLSETGYTFPVYFDTQSDAAINYGAYSLPMSVFVDEQGYVVDLAIGAIDQETLLQKIDKIL